MPDSIKPSQELNPLDPLERAIWERNRVAAYRDETPHQEMTKTQKSHALGAIMAEADWAAEIKILNDQAREEERLP
jgi:hypothetical protein